MRSAALLWVALRMGGCAMGFNPQRVPAQVHVPAEGVSVPTRSRTTWRLCMRA